jgi:hypothetical protein
VLNYYIIDGRISPDVSRLKENALRGGEGFRYLAQVQIVCTSDISMTQGLAEKYIRDFAIQSTSDIQKLFPGTSGEKNQKKQ